MDRFGTHTKKKGKSKGGPSMRQREIKDIRKELRGLKRRWRRAKEEERVGLAELREILRERLKSIRSAEAIYQKKKNKKREKARSKFLNNLYRYTS